MMRGGLGEGNVVKERGSVMNQSNFMQWVLTVSSATVLGSAYEQPRWPTEAFNNRSE